MGQLLLLLVVALTVAAVVFGVTVLVTGADPGLAPVEPDGRAVPLPTGRPLVESDVGDVRFDTGLRGYRMDQVDEALRRAAYDIGYKTELVGVLEAEVEALRAGRLAEADELRDSREAATAARSPVAPEPPPEPLPVAGQPADRSQPVGADRPGADGADQPAAGGDGAGQPAAGGDGADQPVAGGDGPDRPAEAGRPAAGVRAEQA